MKCFKPERWHRVLCAGCDKIKGRETPLFQSLALEQYTERRVHLRTNRFILPSHILERSARSDRFKRGTWILDLAAFDYV